VFWETGHSVNPATWMPGKSGQSTCH